MYAILLCLLTLRPCAHLSQQRSDQTIHDQKVSIDVLMLASVISQAFKPEQACENIQSKQNAK